MIHRWNMYANRGERRIPSLVDRGDIELPCINPGVDNYRHQFDPLPLWSFLQSESDMSERGLYLSLYSTTRPTFDGKQWFLNVAYNGSGGRLQQEATREVSWVDVKQLQLWNSSFRDYAGIHQARGIVDYTLYVSRAFGYCFLLGLTFEEDDDDDRHEFTKFFPSIHHYHQQVAIDETETYLPFHSQVDWYPKNYNQDPNQDSGGDAILIADAVVDEVPSLAGAAERITSTMREWRTSVTQLASDDEANEVELEIGEDIPEGEEG